MKLEVLLSCMNQTDLSIVDDIKINTDVIIVNQTNTNKYTEKKLQNSKIKMITSKQRGLTKSRNLALLNSTGDICILCDDDVEYIEDYSNLILEAFKKIPNADIITFDIERINLNNITPPIKKIRKAPWYKSYGSVTIAFKRKNILEKNIWFDLNFGSGSTYNSGEETIFLNEASKKGLTIYEYPLIIAKVDFKESTWRTGYDEKFFYDKGALLSAAYPKLKYILILYYLVRLYNKTDLSKIQIINWLLKGIKGYNKLYSYNEYRNK